MKTNIITRTNDLIELIESDETKSYYGPVSTVCTMLAEYIGVEQASMSDGLKYATYECMLTSSYYLEVNYEYLPPTQVVRVLRSIVEILNNL